MTDRYWVNQLGGTWDASAPAQNWSATSGGPGGASAPGANDNTFLDANSGGGTITTGSAVEFANLDCSGFTGTLAGSNAVTINGSAKLASTMSFTQSGSWKFQSSGAATIESAGKAFAGLVQFAGTGSMMLLDDFNALAGLSHSQGAFDANDKNLTLKSFNSVGTLARSIKMGSGEWKITGAGSTAFRMSNTGLTLDAETSTVNMTNAAVNTRGCLMQPGLVLNDIKVSAGSGQTQFQNVSCRDLDFTGYSGSVIATASLPTAGNSIKVSRNLTIGSGTNTSNLSITFNGTSVITSNGRKLNNVFVDGGVGAELADAFYCNNLTLLSGAFDTKDQPVKADFSITTKGSATRSLTLGESHIECAGNYTFDIQSATNLTFDPGTSELRLTNASSNQKVFNGGGLTFYDIWINSPVTGLNWAFTDVAGYHDFRVDPAPQNVTWP